MGEAAVGIGLPGLHHRIRNRITVAVVHAPADPEAALCSLRRNERAVLPGQADREVGPDGLRRRHPEPAHACGSSNATASGPRSTMSHLKPSCQWSSVVPQSCRETMRSRTFGSCTELKIGSSEKSGSSGKYICVTSRWVNARPNSEKWMCAGRQALGWFFHGYAPGLIVTNR